MGVALENARLFDETKRLLAETEQRNAELAVINEIGEALARAARLPGRSSTRSATRMRDDLRRRSTSASSLYDARETDRSRRRTSIEHGERLPSRDATARSGSERRSSSRRGAAAAHRDDSRRSQALEALRSSAGRGRPVVAGRADPRRRPRARRHHARSVTPRHAFSDADERLLYDDRLEHGRRARERAPVRRDEASAGRDRAAQRRARGHQRDRRGARQAARLPGDHRRGRRPHPRAYSTATTGIIALYDAADEPDPIPYRSTRANAIEPARATARRPDRSRHRARRRRCGSAPPRTRRRSAHTIVGTDDSRIVARRADASPATVCSA